MPPFMYQIYFDKVGHPEKIVARHLEELLLIIHQMTERSGEMPEWIIRVYK
jgi:hypothetical protein